MISAIFKIIPLQFRRQFWWSAVLSFLNLTMDFISIAVLVPIFAGLLNPNFTLPISNAFLADGLLYFKSHREIIALSVLLFFVLKNILSIRISRFQSNYYYSISNALSIRLLQNFFRNSYVDVKSHKNSTLIKDIVFIPNNFVTYILSSVLQLISEAFLLLVIVCTSLLLNFEVTLFFATVAVVIVIVMYFYEKNALKSINRDTSEIYNANISSLMNAVNGYAEIKISRLETYFIEQFSNSNGSLNKMYSKLTADRLAKPKYTETFLVVSIVSLFLFLSYFSPTYNVLFLSFLFAACIKIIPSVNRILVAVTNISANLYTIDILQSQRLADEMPPIVHQSKVGFENFVRLSNVSFNYKKSPLLLDGVSLSIQKGAIVGIYGNSGIGKSTLTNIFTTLITPNSGNLAVDGAIVNESNKESYLDLIGYVPQTPFILEGSILKNLCLDAPYQPEVLKNYLEIFGLREMIDTLPLKKSTFIGSNGYTLSGGQLQRIAIIRALLRKPKLLILDEATNQLDATLRKEVTSILAEIARKENLTILTISHNVEELERFCDFVYELKNAVLIQKK